MPKPGKGGKKRSLLARIAKRVLGNGSRVKKIRNIKASKVKTKAVRRAARPLRHPAKKLTGPYLEIREQLLKMKDDLLLQIDKKARKERYSLKRDVGDLYDQAYTDRERELALLLGDIENQKLNDINDALYRIGRNEYGTCESCSGTIPLARLRIMPFARHCVQCQSTLEKETGDLRRRDLVEASARQPKVKIEEADA